MISPEIRERFLKDALPVRLGGLAADLARIVSFSSNLKSAASVANLLQESRDYIELTAPALLRDRVEDAAHLVDIQRGLTDWLWIWQEKQNDPAMRAKLADQAQAWSDQVLAMSGLLERE